MHFQYIPYIWSLLASAAVSAACCLARGRSQPAELIEAIRTVARGGSVLSPGLAGRILDELRGESQ